MVWGRHPAQLEQLRALGVDVRSDEPHLTAWANVVVEATRNSDEVALARKLACPRGTVVLKSTYCGQTEANFTGLVIDEVTLAGSCCRTFPPALRLLAHGPVSVSDLIEIIYPLPQALAAFERAAALGVLKLLLRMT
ncbi:MAG: hypothetical protein RML36_16315 [Anaerolineae bacterium]|nr:hypothetical protein [Anaerolineae bacterium]MDW8101039.1 hypothetical protein [Anaerolineae bacterium]